MGSVGNQNQWTPYKDCSQGVCSVYCPQWCYIIFPPPPFTIQNGDDDDSSSSAPDFSPLIIAVIGILASAFIIVSYYTFVSKFCRRRQNTNNQSDSPNLDESGNDALATAAWTTTGNSSTGGGLDESLINSITVCKYQKNNGFVDCSDCSVCLSEFQENENLRLLPKCSHAFHLPCIDAWLKSHSTCPLCRSIIVVVPEGSVREITHHQSANRVDRSGGDDSVVVIVVQNVEIGFREEENSGTTSSSSSVVDGNGVRSEEVVERLMKRSVSLNSCPILISDILREEDDDGDVEDGDDSYRNGIEESMKRSISTGRFVFSMYDKGRTSVLPN